MDKVIIMDDKGFIFTADAILALIVVIVLTASVTAYSILPAYQGEDHQHLEAIASSALEVMEQDGTLNMAAVDTATGNTVSAQGNLTAKLDQLIPPGIAYNLTLKDVNTVTASDNRGLSYSTDQVTKVKVISAPNQGWQGRAWYKVNNFTFKDQPQNVTTTLWNFHNWLTNFDPWSPGGYDRNNNYYTTDGLINNPYWGGGNSPQSISFSVPSNIVLNNAKFLIGSSNKYNGSAYNANITLNGVTYPSYSNYYTFLNNRPGTSGSTTQKMYNFQGILNNSNFANGQVNNFTVKFWNMTGPTNKYTERYDLPWFSIIGNYTTSIRVPQGILFSTSYFPDAAGLAVQDPQDLDGNGISNEYGRIYNLNTGTVSSFTNQRVVTWDNFYNQGTPSNGYDDGAPFVITNAYGDFGTSTTPTKTAVSTTTDVNVPSGNTILDGYAVINAYGGVDGALVEVWNGTDWNTIFNSFNKDGVDYSDESDGYGNIPGIVYIPSYDLTPGQNNKVRITVWDDVPGNDYDLVGLTSCYVTTCYSALNVGWRDIPYDSHQSSNNNETQTKSFTVSPDATLAYLFVGAGMDSQNIVVKYSNDSRILYNGPVQFYLDLASLDASKGIHYITTPSSTGANYTLKSGTYSLTVSAISNSNGWSSGDANAELFSGTRIAVIYPALYNQWAEAFSNDANTAENLAYNNLTGYLNTSLGQGSYDSSKIQTQAIWAGNLPNQATVRLNLWKQ